MATDDVSAACPLTGRAPRSGGDVVASAPTCAGEDGRITVCVRARPLTEREAAQGSCLVFRDDKSVTLLCDDACASSTHDADETPRGSATTCAPSGRCSSSAAVSDDAAACAGAKWSQHSFTFDHAYAPDTPQERVYADIGEPVVQLSLRGYNTCIFAYGQTGSGKSYSMMGPNGGRDVACAPGIVPRLCRDLFAQLQQLQDQATHRGAADGVAAAAASSCCSHDDDDDHDVTCADATLSSSSCTRYDYHVTVSYAEIYRERVHCLLRPSASHLKVRQHPVLGVYVEGLTELPAQRVEQVLQAMAAGNEARHTAATRMNDTSSRSHAIFALQLVQRRTHGAATPATSTTTTTTTTTERRARINLVDLAGSERVRTSGATGAALREGAHINQSLTTLGLVISALAEASKAGQRRARHIPYRDSTLTFLLKESLGGNSRTFMLSTVSPARVYGDETLSTLRYADRAKAIVTRAFVNETAGDRRIRELEAEVQQLRQRIDALLQMQQQQRPPLSLSPSPSPPLPQAATTTTTTLARGRAHVDATVTTAADDGDRYSSGSGSSSDSNSSSSGNSSSSRDGVRDALTLDHDGTSPHAAAASSSTTLQSVQALCTTLRHAEQAMRYAREHEALLLQDGDKDTANAADTAATRTARARTAAAVAGAVEAEGAQASLSSLLRVRTDVAPYLVNLTATDDWVVAYLTHERTVIGTAPTLYTTTTTDDNNDEKHSTSAARTDDGDDIVLTSSDDDDDNVNDSVAPSRARASVPRTRSDDVVGMLTVSACAHEADDDSNNNTNDDDDVGAVHCWLDKLPGNAGVLLCPCARYDVFVNDARTPATRLTLLHSGDVLSLGHRGPQFRLVCPVMTTTTTTTTSAAGEASIERTTTTATVGTLPLHSPRLRVVDSARTRGHRDVVAVDAAVDAAVRCTRRDGRAVDDVQRRSDDGSDAPATTRQSSGNGSGDHDDSSRSSRNSRTSNDAQANSVNCCTATAPAAEATATATVVAAPCIPRLNFDVLGITRPATTTTATATTATSAGQLPSPARSRGDDDDDDTMTTAVASSSEAAAAVAHAARRVCRATLDVSDDDDDDDSGAAGGDGDMPLTSSPRAHTPRRVSTTAAARGDGGGRACSRRADQQHSSRSRRRSVGRDYHRRCRRHGDAPERVAPSRATADVTAYRTLNRHTFVFVGHAGAGKTTTRTNLQTRDTWHAFFTHRTPQPPPTCGLDRSVVDVAAPVAMKLSLLELGGAACFAMLHDQLPSRRATYVLCFSLLAGASLERFRHTLENVLCMSDHDDVHLVLLATHVDQCQLPAFPLHAVLRDVEAQVSAFLLLLQPCRERRPRVVGCFAVDNTRRRVYAPTLSSGGGRVRGFDDLLHWMSDHAYACCRRDGEFVGGVVPARCLDLARRLTTLRLSRRLYLSTRDYKTFARLVDAAYATRCSSSHNNNNSSSSRADDGGLHAHTQLLTHWQLVQHAFRHTRLRHLVIVDVRGVQRLLASLACCVALAHACRGGSSSGGGTGRRDDGEAAMRAVVEATTAAAAAAAMTATRMTKTTRGGGGNNSIGTNALHLSATRSSDDDDDDDGSSGGCGCASGSEALVDVDAVMHADVYDLLPYGVLTTRVLAAVTRACIHSTARVQPQLCRLLYLLLCYDHVVLGHTLRYSYTPRTMRSRGDGDTRSRAQQQLSSSSSSNSSDGSGVRHALSRSSSSWSSSSSSSSRTRDRRHRAATARTTTTSTRAVRWQSFVLLPAAFVTPAPAAVVQYVPRLVSGPFYRFTFNMLPTHFFARLLSRLSQRVAAVYVGPAQRRVVAADGAVFPLRCHAHELDDGSSNSSSNASDDDSSSSSSARRDDVLHARATAAASSPCAPPLTATIPQLTGCSYQHDYRRTRQAATTSGNVAPMAATLVSPPPPPLRLAPATHDAEHVGGFWQNAVWLVGRNSSRALVRLVHHSLFVCFDDDDGGVRRVVNGGGSSSEAFYDDVLESVRSVVRVSPGSWCAEAVLCTHRSSDDNNKESDDDDDDDFLSATFDLAEVSGDEGGSSNSSDGSRRHHRRCRRRAREATAAAAAGGHTFYHVVDDNLNSLAKLRAREAGALATARTCRSRNAPVRVCDALRRAHSDNSHDDDDDVVPVLHDARAPIDATAFLQVLAAGDALSFAARQAVTRAVGALNKVATAPHARASARGRAMDRLVDALARL